MRAFRHTRLGQEGAAIRQCSCLFGTNATGCVQNGCETHDLCGFHMLSCNIILYINIQNILSVGGLFIF